MKNICSRCGELKKYVTYYPPTPEMYDLTDYPMGIHLCKKCKAIVDTYD